MCSSDLVQINYLMDKGAFVAQPDGTFSVDFTKVKGAVRDLVGELLTIEAEGDYARAKKLLDEAGFSKMQGGFRTSEAGERFSIEITTTAGNRVREQVAQVIQSQLRQVGIELRIKAEPPRIFSEALNRRAFSGLAMYAWVQRPQGVPRTTLHSDEIPSAKNGWSGQNYPGYVNPEMDKALDAAERELDEGRRRGFFAEIQKLYADDLPALPMYFRVDPFVLPKPLKGVVPTGHLNSTTLWVEQWKWEN